MDGVDGIVYERVVSNKSDNVIWEVFGGFYIGCKGFFWVLKKVIIKKRNKLIKSIFLL